MSADSERPEREEEARLSPGKGNCLHAVPKRLCTCRIIPQAWPTDAGAHDTQSRPYTSSQLDVLLVFGSSSTWAPSSTRAAFADARRNITRRKPAQAPRPSLLPYRYRRRPHNRRWPSLYRSHANDTRLPLRLHFSPGPRDCRLRPPSSSHDERAVDRILRRAWKGPTWNQASARNT